MKTVVVYIYPNHNYRELADWFLHSYDVCTSNKDHDSLIVTQGWDADAAAKDKFARLPNVNYLTHDNTGYDIGAFQFAARVVECDLMVFFGATAYLKRNGWLERAKQSFEKYGDTLFGSMGHQGAGASIHPHIRTTGFWISPSLLNEYPSVVKEPSQRYGFEHGSESLTTWILGLNKIPWVITYNGEYQIPQWGAIQGGYRDGGQENLLTGDRLTRPPYYPTP